MSFSIHSHVVEALGTAWSAAAFETASGVGDLPTESELTPSTREWAFVLELAFKASLHTDEARATSFRIAFERNLAPLARGLGSVNEVRFEQRLPVSVEELVKLAHALGKPPAVIWLRRDAGTGEYWFSGMGPLGHSRPTLDPDTDPTEPLPAVPVIDVTGPGRLRVLKGALAVAWVGPDGFETLRDGIDCWRVAALASDAYIQRLLAKLLRPETPAEVVAEVHRYVVFRLGNALARGLKSIVDRRHGGMLVLLPGDDLPLCTRAKYRCSPGVLGGDLGASVHRFLAPDLAVRWHQWVLSSGPEAPSALEQQVLWQASSDALADAGKVADDIGALSGADGAVALSADLRVLGFGVEIITQEDPGEVWYRAHFTDGRIVTDGEPVSIAAHGTRHRAASRVCREVPGTWCFVVSQDGVAKAVCSIRNDVAFFEHFERTL